MASHHSHNYEEESHAIALARKRTASRSRSRSIVPAEEIEKNLAREDVESISEEVGTVERDFKHKQVRCCDRSVPAL